ncbi:hypothetical protein M3Y98_00965100 [Aphelenchoides besseyi]|nr:hypothetical protein M3Y98_00965100 [Aphelenchoides besseyi]
MTVWYQPQAGSFTYNSIAVGFPLDITITPNQITLKSSTVSKVDCSSTPVQFEKISGGNKIEINYKPENASEAYFKMKYNAGLYDGLSKETTDIAWILFIVGLVLFVLLLMSVIVLVVILVRLKNAEKKLDEQQPIETPINESKFSTAVGNEDMKTTPTTGGTGDTKITATLINTAEPNKAHPRTVETTIKSADLRTAEPKNSVEKMALKPRAMILDEKAKYIGQGHKVGMDDYPTVSLNYVNLIRLVFVWMDDVVSDFDVTVTAQEATKAKTAENKKKLKRTMSNENFTFNPVNKPLRSQEKKTLGNID